MSTVRTHLDFFPLNTIVENFTGTTVYLRPSSKSCPFSRSHLLTPWTSDFLFWKSDRLLCFWCWVLLIKKHHLTSFHTLTAAGERWIWASELIQVKVWLGPRFPRSSVSSVGTDHISAEIKVKWRKKRLVMVGGWASACLRGNRRLVASTRSGVGFTSQVKLLWSY